MREIIYWGAGNIGKMCIQQHMEIDPVFLIDSSVICASLYGKEIKRPAEIEDWFRYFIVITMRAPKEIEEILEQKGLQRGKDFLWYEDFFFCAIPSVTESIKIAQAYKEQCEKTVEQIMIVAPTVTRRNKDTFLSFLKAYAQKRQPKEVLLFSDLQTFSVLEITKKTQCHTFSIPYIWNWDGSCINEANVYVRGVDNLTIEEMEWLTEMENRKTSPDREKSLHNAKKRYCYFDAIVKCIQPSQIIIWGGWDRDSYILGHIASIRGILHGYMEYGWIPGTYQFDLHGIAGQGEYAVQPDSLDKIAVAEGEIKALQHVKQYVIDNKLDTRTFCETEADAVEYSKIDPGRKTILLVGMDERGMGMNPQHPYWNQCISSVYRSMEEILEDLLQICRNNRYNLIFKPHPGEQPIDMDKFKRGDMIYVKDAEIDKLIQMCDAAVSMASAVDYKVLMYGKPLVQIGITGLRGKKCTYDVKERSCLEGQVKAALRDGMTEQQKMNYDIFLARLLKTHLWDDMSDKKISYGLTLETDFFEVKYESSCVCAD